MSLRFAPLPFEPTNPGQRMFKVEPSVIDDAFDAFAKKYVRRSKAWDMDHHVQLWLDAIGTLSDPELAGFTSVYDHLRSFWQLARGKKDSLAPADAVCSALAKVPNQFRHMRLSSVSEEDTPSLLTVVTAVGALKKLKSGPSIMVASKLLHFLNPRLFVIVDRGMMWDGAFSRWWIWEPIVEVRDRLARNTANASDAFDDVACDPFTYVAVLTACADLVRRNPLIRDGLARFLKRECKEVVPPDNISEFEAAAAEWFLLGVAELVPAGVSVLR